MSDSLSRRAFLGQASAVPMTTLVPDPSTASEPKQAWVILAVNWEYNDEYSFAEGDRLLPQMYFDREQAEAECRRQCDEFCRAQTPEEFEADIWWYLERPEEGDETQVTWPQLFEAGFPQPYHVQELEL